MSTSRYGWKQQQSFVNENNNTNTSYVEDNNGRNLDRFMIDKYSKGFQILREYVYFYGFNFIPLCQSTDTQGKQLISKDEFRYLLNSVKNEFYFTAENIEEILTDSPTHFDGKNYFISYIELYNLASQYLPKTKYSLANIFGLKQKNPEDHQLEKWEREIDRMKSNFWDRKEGTEEWNFEYTELERLETSIMRSLRGDEEDGSGAGANGGDDGSGGAKPSQDVLENDIYEKSIKNLFQINNQTILKNFDIRMALHMVKIIKPSNITTITDEQIEKYFNLNFITRFRKDRSATTLKHYFEDDFLRMFSDWFGEVKLTNDEVSLLYNRIWEDSNYGAFTYKTICAWICKNRSQRIRELRTIGLTESQQKRILNKEQASAPKLFKELVKYAYSFGLNFLVTSLKPIIEREQHIMLNNIQLYFKSLGIGFVQQDINDLKFYLANHGAIHLQDVNGGTGFMTADMLLDATKLIDLITQEAQKIAMHLLDFKQLGNRSKEQARRSVQSKIIQGVVSRLQIKLRALTDDNDLIEEIKLRKTVADAFSEIDQTDLDLIFSKMQNIMMPSKYSSQRKIYLPEFIDFLLGGPLFDDDLFAKINEFEKHEKMGELNLQKTNTTKLLDRSDNNLPKNDTPTPGSEKINPQPVPGAKDNEQQQQLPPQQSDTAEDKKFFVITKESLLLKQAQEKKAQLDAKKSKKTSEQQKITQEASKFFANKNQMTFNPLEIVETQIFEDAWQPDYRKIAEDQLQNERPREGIDFMKGGFVSDYNDTAFVSQPIDDRSLIVKFYDVLQQRVIQNQQQIAGLDDFGILDVVLLAFKRKLQGLDPSLRGVITSQQFYSFIKLNFRTLTAQQCYQLRNFAETYSGTEKVENSPDVNISYTYFCMHLHKFIASNILIQPKSPK